MRFDYSVPLIQRLATRWLPVWDYVRILCSGAKTIIHGSYYTTNVGDRSIGLVLRRELRKRRVRSLLVSRFCKSPAVQNVIVGGGGVIHNNYKPNLSLRTSFIDDNRNVIYVGVGCPGFTSLSKKDRNDLARMSEARYISVRDSFSRDILFSKVNLEPEVLSCPSWLFSRNINCRDLSVRNFIFRLYYNLRFRGIISRSIPSSHRSQRIGIVLSGLFDLKWLPEVKRMLSSLSKEAKLCFVPFVGKDIEFYARELSDLGMTCFPLNGPVKTYQMIMKMDRVVAGRYHSLIFALLANKPVMVLPYSQKMVSLAQDLDLAFTDFTKENHTYRFNDDYNRDLIAKKITKAETQIKRVIEHLRDV